MIANRIEIDIGPPRRQSPHGGEPSGQRSRNEEAESESFPFLAELSATVNLDLILCAGSIRRFPPVPHPNSHTHNSLPINRNPGAKPLRLGVSFAPAAKSSATARKASRR
jgi:hypothetical protein